MLRQSVFTFVNILIVCFFLVLPYIIFGNKLFIGGDDTRLFYVYPLDYIANTRFFSWSNFSTIGWNFPGQAFLPLTFIWIILDQIVKTKLILSHLAFSLPLILGLIFFQKLARETLRDDKDNYKLEILATSLFYVMSPIVIQNHYLNPLIPIWLIGLIPGVCFYFLRYLRTANRLYILISVILVSFLSFGANNIPWIFGFLIPLFSSLLICSLLFKKNVILIFIKRFAIFSVIIVLSQSYWLLSFFMTYLDTSTNSITGKITSEDFIRNFVDTVKVTSTGTIIYPLLNLFHRKIAFDFGWNLKNIFTGLYDKTYMLNVVYVIVLFLGIFNIKKFANYYEKKIFLILLIAFIISLYLFTVNIGPLQYLFFAMGRIPGFVMFRNAFDKFALGYSILYSLLMTYCLVILRRKYIKSDKKNIYFLSLSLFFTITVINFLPVKQLINSPLWTTKNIYRSINIPDEYLSFMQKVKQTVSPTNNILSLPYGGSSYTVIKDKDTDNVYVGISPVVIFSGVNDISGSLSFNFSKEADVVDKLIEKKDYAKFNEILYKYNMNYIILTKNIPNEVKNSFIFNSQTLKSQDSKFLSEITSKKIFSSDNDNYELHESKRRNSLLSSNDLSYKRISRIKYQLKIKNLKNKSELIFNDSFHNGWKIYLTQINDKLDCKAPLLIQNLKTTECRAESKLFELSDLSFIWANPIFENSHEIKNGFSNKWVLDPEYIKKKFDKKFYIEHQDGSIDIRMVLYFKPQIYFYIGTFLSILTIGVLCFFVVRKSK